MLAHLGAHAGPFWAYVGTIFSDLGLLRAILYWGYVVFLDCHGPMTCRRAFFVALRRRNANMTCRDAFCVHIMSTIVDSRPDERKSPRRYSETPKIFSGLLTSRDAFSVAVHRENTPARIGPRARTSINHPLSLTVRTPQCGHTVWGTIINKYMNLKTFFLVDYFSS